MSMDTMNASPTPGYPVNLDIEYPEKLSRVLNNIPYLKLLLAVPHLFVLLVLSLFAALIYFVAWWAILFTGKYPQGMFNFYVNIQRWGVNLNAYVYMMRDEYPPFSGEAGKYPAVTYSVDYPERSSRLLNNIPYLKIILLVPHFIVLMFLIIGWVVVYFIAWWAILFTGSYPRGMYEYSVGVFRWSTRINAYLGMLTDAYPPFSLK